MPDRRLPKLGLGTFTNTDPEECATDVRASLEMGYRHLDTAQLYRNERYVGNGILRADISREDVFIATKVDPETLGHEDIHGSTMRSLERLDIEYIDLLYVHWPTGAYEAAETLAAFDELREEGYISHIGVSNFTLELLDEARAVLDAPLFAHQVEMHPLCQQDRLHAYAIEYGHWLVAYAPLAKQEVFSVPELVEIADKHGVTPAQVSLAWLLGKEHVSAIPKATGDHIHENYEALSLELDSDDIERIESIEREHRRYTDPPHGDDPPW